MLRPQLAAMPHLGDLHFTAGVFERRFFASIHYAPYGAGRSMLRPYKPLIINGCLGMNMPRYVCKIRGVVF